MLRQMTPEAIFNALTLGRMQMQAISLSDAEQRAVAVFLAGKPLRPVTAPVVVNKCAAIAGDARAGREPASGTVGGNGRQHALSEGRRPHRRRPAEAEAEVGVRLSQASPPRARSRRSPAAACSSPARTAKCTRSTRRPAARTGPSRRRPACARRLSVGPYKNAGRVGSGGLLRRRARQRLRRGCAAPGSRSGSARWTSIRSAAITGAPTVLRRPRVRAGAGAERGRPGRHAASYECCTFRGSLVGARREHRRGAVEDLHHRRAQAARQEQGRRAACGARPAAASGRRRRSMPSAAWSTSPPATATPIRRRRRPTPWSRST